MDVVVVNRNQEAVAVDSLPFGLLVGGKWISAESDAQFGVEDPSTGVLLATVADASASDASAAVQAAVDAQPGWASTPPRVRGDVLYRAFELMIERLDDLALLMTLEMGKPIAESRSEVMYAAEFLRWFSEEAVRISGNYATTPSGSGRMVVTRHPVGPALLITPWNFPMAMATRKIGPAIASGCTMVAKPSEETPLSTLAVASILLEAGLPDGVLNVITTSDPAQVVEPLLSDGRIRKLSFTGSTPVGKRLLARSAETVLRVSLELGGNAPFIVFPDADIHAAVEGAMLAKMRNIGEACTAANRFYVHADIVSEFSARLASRMDSLVLGRGVEPETQVGPLINHAALTKVSSLVNEAVVNGAEILCGGGALEGNGHFYRPTVLTNVNSSTRLLDSEVFGPVAPVLPFVDEDAVVAAANNTSYGLVSYVYTQDFARAVRVGEALECGMVGLNQGMVSNPAAPFGGTKQSGLGREGADLGIYEFLETKYIAFPVS